MNDMPRSCLLPLVLAALAALCASRGTSVLPEPVGAPVATATPTDQPPGPTELFLGLDQVDSFRITTREFWDIGHGSMNGVMQTEDDALVLARIAIGEAPSSLDDRIYIMWLIRLRAELGFKNAAYRGWNPPLDVWGPPTELKQEALCWRGCQFSPAAIADWTPFPASLPATSPIRAMLHPTDAQLPTFAITYDAAIWVLSLSFEQFPLALRGYDSFRSASVIGEGRRNRSGGLLNDRFFANGNVWQDIYPQDNLYWLAGQQ